jgi:hypothetical protein
VVVLVPGGPFAGRLGVHLGLIQGIVVGLAADDQRPGAAVVDDLGAGALLPDVGADACFDTVGHRVVHVGVFVAAELPAGPVSVKERAGRLGEGDVGFGVGGRGELSAGGDSGWLAFCAHGWVLSVAGLTW